MRKFYLVNLAADVVDNQSDRWEVERNLGRLAIAEAEAERLAEQRRYDEIVARQRRQQVAHPLWRFA